MSVETWKIVDRECQHFESSYEGGTDELGFTIERRREGRSAGVLMIHVRCHPISYSIIPTRGMSIWKATCNDVEFGWRSPVIGPVHPSFVPIAEPSGLGFLDGFDELFVRCGLTSNGAPDFDDHGRIQYPLHGRIANTPAESVEVVIDDRAQTIQINGTVRESRFHGVNLLLESTLSCRVGQTTMSFQDTITNLSSRQSTAQILYHVNFGPPLLDTGARLIAPVQEVAPRNVHAANFIDDWMVFGPPESGFEEVVYFSKLFSDTNDQTSVMLQNSDASIGAYLDYNTRQLPYFSLWKDTGDHAEGYVTGLEPATNFPNPRSFETKRGRLITLAPGASYPIQLELGFCTDSAAVSKQRQRIESLQQKDPHSILWPDPNYSPEGETDLQ